MPDFATEPLTFDGARRFLEQKVEIPTNLSSREIANKTPAEFRARAFFSARVMATAELKAMRSVVEKIAAGSIGYARGREMLRDFLKTRGLVVPDAGAEGDGDLKQLGSSARLNLILNQNVAMAHAVGQREVSENEAVVEAFPNYKYVAVQDGNTRSAHAALDGLVLPKSDPFWNTHYPPWEFNCRCFVLDSDEPANGRATSRDNSDGSQTSTVSIGGRPVQVPPNESGFVFRSSPGEVFDPSFSFESVENTRIRESLKAGWAEHQRELQPARKAPAERAQRDREPARPSRAPAAQARTRTPEQTRAAIQDDYGKLKLISTTDLRAMMKRTAKNVDFNWDDLKKDDLVIEYVRRVYGDEALRDFMQSKARPGRSEK